MLSEILELTKYKHSATLGPIYGKLYKALIKAEIEEKKALSITGRISAEGKAGSLLEAYKRARTLAVEDIIISGQIERTNDRQIAAFIGPTGSGKTSSMVKIAVISKLIFKSDVLLISTDTYKVGATEQLQTFASIASIPYKEVYSTEDLKSLLNKETERDIIFIDTTGRNPRNSGQLEEISDYLKASKPDKLYVVQSATTSLETFETTLESYKQFNPDAAVLTKIDEAAAIGGIVSVLAKRKLPLAYISSGQRVPEDIDPAELKKLAEKLLPDELLENIVKIGR